MYFEARDLRVGQMFAFEQGGALCSVSDVDIFDYEGHCLFLYKADDGLHGHYRDHTPVWIWTE